MRYLITLLLLACAPVSQPPVMTPPPPPPPPPVTVPQPQPVPVPEDKTFTKLNPMFNCELLYRKDKLIPGRYWLYTENCNAYFTLKWFNSPESTTSISYIGLVGYTSEVYIDTKGKPSTLFIKATPGSGVDPFDDTKNQFVTVYSVNIS